MGRAAKNPGTGLTEKQAEFAMECVRLGSPARAYRKVYDASNMSQNTVWTNAKALLDNSVLAARVQHYAAIADRAADVTVEKIARELFRVAFFDPRELFDEDGRPIPINELSEDAARAIAGLDVEDLFEKNTDGARERVGNIKKYKIANKLQALETLAKWKKMLVDLHEVGRPGEFERMSEKELEAFIEEKAVKIGWGKAVRKEKPKMLQ